MVVGGAEALQFGALVASGMSASMQMVVLAPISSNVQWEAREGNPVHDAGLYEAMRAALP